MGFAKAQPILRTGPLGIVSGKRKSACCGTINLVKVRQRPMRRQTWTQPGGLQWLVTIIAPRIQPTPTARPAERRSGAGVRRRAVGCSLVSTGRARRGRRKHRKCRRHSLHAHRLGRGQARRLSVRRGDREGTEKFSPADAISGALTTTRRRMARWSRSAAASQRMAQASAQGQRRSIRPANRA